MSNEGNDERKILRYDPMTGKPIYEEEPVVENAQENSGDGQTEAPAEQKERKILKYDPMTGEPIYEGEEEKKERKIIKYDPMTGEPIYEGDEEKKERKIVKYDPMTGEPIYEGDERLNKSSVTPVQQTAPISGKTVATIVAVVAVLAIIILIASQIIPSILLGKNAKFILAAKKSWEPGKLIETLDVSDTLKSGDYTVALSGEVNGDKIASEFASNVKKTEYSAYIDADIMGTDIDGTAYMDKEKILLSVPAILDEAIMYNYVDEKTGFLADVGLDEFDEYLQTVANQKDTTKYEKRIEKACIKAVNKLDFEKIDSKEFEVNGKDKKCAGYETELNDDFVEVLSDEFSDIIEDYADENDLKPDVVNPSKEALRSMKDVGDLNVKIRLYLYGGRIACLEMVDGRTDQSASVIFEGGSYWTENMKISYEGVNVATISGETKDGKEERSLSVGGQKICGYKYNTRNGDLELSVRNGTESGKVSGELKKKNGGFELKINNISASGLDIDSLVGSIEGTFSIKKGANIKKISDKDAYDICNMSESEIKDIVWELINKSKDLLGNIPGFSDYLPTRLW